MAELPKSVREQLARAQANSQHPDADLLTAFSENTLTEAERKSVTDHLASCSECREVLFLAQPEAESAQVVVAPARTRRLNWMAWASAAAVIVVVGSAVVLRKNEVQKIDEPKLVATDRKVAPPAETLDRAEHDRPSEPSQVAKGTRVDRMVAAKPVPAVPSSLQDAKRDKDVVAARQEKSAQVAASRDSELNEVAANAGIVAGNSAKSGPSNSANVSNVYAANNNVAAAPPVATPAKKQKEELASRRSMGTDSFGYSLAVPAGSAVGRAHWRISGDGKVERSYRNDAWSPVLLNAGAAFKVVSVAGNVVWAGGEHGTLFVSRDGGTNWIPVKIATTADIISIHVDDELHCVLRTADGKAWKSPDGGNTWSVQ